jgi:peptidoglycan hydrolase-like protein with peptidoglycan-binding domain
MGCKDPQAQNYERFVYHKNSLCTYASGISQEPVRIEKTPVTSSLSYSGTLIKQGATGEVVTWIQQQLNRHNDSLISVDGMFGGETLRAIRIFQEKHRLVIDGVVGPETWSWLAQ